MKKSIIYLLGIAIVIPAFMSCSDFLDQNPDLRTTLDSEEKIANILVSAYISGAGSYQLVAELSSDNVCDYGITKNYNQFYQDVYEWAEEVTSNNDAPRNIWSSNYNNIANANQALSAIEELGGPTTTRLKASKGEALICRAYSHFVLANMFCMPYNPATAGNCLGIPYMDHAETDLNPRYERGTLQEVYEMIGKDIEAGIPLIDDTAYSVPKYHFNYKAACCFASRYYLFMQDWGNAIKYATMALTSNPSSLLRDYSAIAALPKGTSRHQEYVNSASTANFLLQAATSNSGLLFDWYSTAGRYSHGKLQGIYETVQPKKGGPWGSSVTFKAPHAVLASSGKYVLPRTWRVFQYTDPVAGTGFNKAISVLFTSEEALLNRAEAYIMKMNEDGSRQGPGGYKPLRREPLLGRVQIHDGGFDHQMGYGNLPRLLRTLRRKDLGQQPADAQSQEKAPCGPLQHARRGRPAGEHASGAHLHAPLPVPPRRHAVVRHPSLRHHGLPLPAR